MIKDNRFGKYIIQTDNSKEECQKIVKDNLTKFGSFSKNKCFYGKITDDTFKISVNRSNGKVYKKNSFSSINCGRIIAKDGGAEIVIAQRMAIPVIVFCTLFLNFTLWLSVVFICLKQVSVAIVPLIMFLICLFVIIFVVKYSFKKDREDIEKMFI